MTEIETRVADLIKFSSEKSPLEFENTFKEVVNDKVLIAIQNHKIDMAKTLFNTPEPE